MERNGFARGHDLELDRWDVLHGPLEHPFVAGLPFDGRGDTRVLVGFECTKDETFVIAEDKNVLDSVFQLFSWLHEKGLLALDKLLVAKLRLSVIADRVQDHTVLSGRQCCDIDDSDDFLVHIGDVSFHLIEGDEVFFPVFARLARLICERPQSSDMNGSLVCQNHRVAPLDNLFVRSRQVSSLLPNEPFFASDPLCAIAISRFTDGPEL